MVTPTPTSLVYAVQRPKKTKPGEIPAGWEVLYCRICGAKYTGPPSIMAGRKYCTRPCRDQKLGQDQKLAYDKAGEISPCGVQARGYLKRNPEKHQAQLGIKRLVWHGKLKKETSCGVCGDTHKLRFFLWSYEPQHWPYAQTLCARCHGVARGVRGRARKAGKTWSRIFFRQWRLEPTKKPAPIKFETSRDPQGWFDQLFGGIR